MCISAPAGIASGVVVSGLPCLKDCPATLPNLIGYNKGWFYGQTPNPDLNVSMKKANFMDKHPVQTSMSMKKANFMDEHHVQTSTSMKKANFMDEQR